MRGGGCSTVSTVCSTICGTGCGTGRGDVLRNTHIAKRRVRKYIHRSLLKMTVGRYSIRTRIYVRKWGCAAIEEENSPTLAF